MSGILAFPSEKPCCSVGATLGFWFAAPNYTSKLQLSGCMHLVITHSCSAFWMIRDFRIEWLYNLHYFAKYCIALNFAQFDICLPIAWTCTYIQATFQYDGCNRKARSAQYQIHQAGCGNVICYYTATALFIWPWVVLGFCKILISMLARKYKKSVGIN